MTTVYTDNKHPSGEAIAPPSAERHVHRNEIGLDTASFGPDNMADESGRSSPAHNNSMPIRKLMALMAMAGLWTSAQAPLYLFGKPADLWPPDSRGARPLLLTDWRSRCPNLHLFHPGRH